MDLDDVLGIDMSDPIQRNAQQIVRARHALVEELVLLRSTRGISRADMARRLSCSEARIVEIEAHHDPHLSVLALYALAISAAITFKVQLFEEYEAQSFEEHIHDWHSTPNYVWCQCGAERRVNGERAS